MPILVDELLVEVDAPAAPGGKGAAPAKPDRATPGQADRLMARALLVDRQRRLEAD